jgi:hypothetical protein
MPGAPAPVANGNGQYHGPPPPVLAAPFGRVDVWLQPKFKTEQEASQFPADWYFRYWRNHPMKFRRRFFGNAEDGITIGQAMQALVMEHNHWTWPAEDGSIRELPPASEEAFWDDLPLDLLLAMMAAITDDISAPLPNSLMRTPTSSLSTSPPASEEPTPALSESLGPTSEAS